LVIRVLFFEVTNIIDSYCSSVMYSTAVNNLIRV